MNANRIRILQLLSLLVCFGMLLPCGVSADVAAAAEGSIETAPSEEVADVVYVATPHDVVVRMLELADVKEQDLLYDLGCGDGRIVITAARQYGCRGVGYDIKSIRIAESRRHAKNRGVDELVSFKRQDIFELDLTPASVVTLYLLPKLNVRLIPQLEKLKPGSRIVSHDFAMKGVKPDKKVRMVSKEDGVEHTLFLWTIPLNKREAKKETD